MINLYNKKCTPYYIYSIIQMKYFSSLIICFFFMLCVSYGSTPQQQPQIATISTPIRYYSKQLQNSCDSLYKHISSTNKNCTTTDSIIIDIKANFNNLNNAVEKQRSNVKHIVAISIITFILSIISMCFWIFNSISLKKQNMQLDIMRNLQLEKERIARDLHDNVGGQLSYIAYSLNDVRHDNPNNKEIMESLSQSIRSIIGSLRDTIWALSDENITVCNLSDKLKTFSKQLFAHTNTAISFYEHITNDNQIVATRGLNVYRMCQEILTNSFKYAQATRIKVTIEGSQNFTQISITDNGIGFDVSKHYEDHYGLEIIKKRAKENAITLQLKTDINQGTSYTLTLY